MKRYARSSIVIAALLHGACAYELAEGEALGDDVAVTNEPLYVKGTRLWPQDKPIPGQPVLSDMGYNQGWRIHDHPRFVRDVSGDGRPDLVGFGAAGIYVSTALGGSAFGPMQLWAIRYSASDALLANGSALPVLEHTRGLGDFDGDGAADAFAFRADGMHTTDLSIHIVGHQPSDRAPLPRAIGRAVGTPALHELAPFSRTEPRAR